MLNLETYKVRLGEYHELCFLKTKFYQGFPANTVVTTVTAKEICQDTYSAFVSMLLAKWNLFCSAVSLVLRVFDGGLLTTHGDSFSFRDRSLCF